MSLNEIAQEIRKCKKCGLWKNRRNAIPGEGPANTKIMFIGEAGGMEEDLQGRPFVGDAGKFLNKLLKIAGLKREEVFIGNIIKCRPPFNRIPNKKEIETCIPYLLKQIEIIKPKLIVLLGNTALKTLLDKKLTVSKAHGKIFEKNTQKYFVMHHPAAVLYNPKLKEVMMRDAERLKNIIRR